jgi:hypothetical protein
MLEFKAKAADQGLSQAEGDGPGISPANLLRIETSRLDAAKRGWFADFGFFATLAALFSGWGADRAELQPIPVRIRDRL